MLYFFYIFFYFNLFSFIKSNKLYKLFDFFFFFFASFDFIKSNKLYKNICLVLLYGPKNGITIFYLLCYLFIACLISFNKKLQIITKYLLSVPETNVVLYYIHWGTKSLCQTLIWHHNLMIPMQINHEAQLGNPGL